MTRKFNLLLPLLGLFVTLGAALAQPAARTVMVQSNNALLLYPTNFWSANAAQARTGLGLGSAATNPASAFQPSSLILSNLAAGGGLGVTNITGTLSIVSGGTGATNATGARSNLGLGTAATNPATAFQPSSTILDNLSLSNGGSLTNLQAASLVGLIPTSSIPPFILTNIGGTLPVIQGGTGATNAQNARQNLGATLVGGALFTATNAEAARTALSLGTAATSAATAFQPADVSLTNLTANNGGSLTNIPIAGVVGLQSNLDTKLATNGNASGLINITAASIIGTVPSATNVTGVVAIANGGTGESSAAGARTSLGATTVGGNLFTLVNPNAVRFLRLNADNTATALSASDFRTAIGFSTAATNDESAFQPASANLTPLAANDGSGLTNLALSNVVGLQTALNTVALASNVSGVVAITNGGTGATNAATARTNLGLGWSALTNTDATSFRNAIGLSLLALTNTNNATFRTAIELGTTNNASFLSVEVSDGITIGDNTNSAIYFEGNSAAFTRTNLGLPWSGLTNANAATFQTAIFGTNTNPVLVNTNGQVVSPTNFWQVAPIVTRFVEFDPATNATTNIAAARNLHIHSLAISRTGVTSTITLPTTNSFNGDIALVVHQGPTSSVTAVRTAGAATNLVTLNQFDEAVEFVYYNNVWQFNHNRSFIEPIYFSGTNAAANRAASRTNLGLGTTNIVNFDSLTLSQNGALKVGVDGVGSMFFSINNNGITIEGEPNSGTVFELIGTNLAPAIRNNIGIPWSGLTNTNSTNFRNALELGSTNNVTFRTVSASDSEITQLTFSGIFSDSNNWNAYVSLEERVLSADGVSVFQWATNGNVTWVPFIFTNNSAPATRTNLGLPWTGLTNANADTFLTALRLTEDISSTNLLTITAARHLYDETGQQPSLKGDDGEFITSASFITTNAPADTTNAVRWLIISEGTNSYRVPLYQ